MKKTLHTLLALTLLSSLFAKDLCVKVDYKEQSDNAEDKIAQVYFDSQDGMYMLVESPVKQFVRMDLDIYTYYYPNENMALIMGNRDGALASAPVQLFLYSGTEDMGISNLGFSLKGHSFKGDTLIKTWELKGKKKDEYLKIDAYHSKRDLLKTISYNNENEIMKIVRFNEWSVFDNYNYPLHITMIEPALRKEYHFSNIEILDGIPKEVINKFKLPHDCVKYEYTW